MNYNERSAAAIILVLAFFLSGSTITVVQITDAQISLVPGINTPSLPKLQIKNHIIGTTNTTSPPRNSSTINLNFSNATGSIVSLQNDQIFNRHGGSWADQFVRNGIWLLSGKWSIVTSGSSKSLQNMIAPRFNASFNMMLLNGTAIHKHKIFDFIMVGSPVISAAERSVTFKGTATVTMKDGPHTGVPIVITIYDKSILQIAVGQAKTNKHFGASPIVGTVASMD